MSSEESGKVGKDCPRCGNFVEDNARFCRSCGLNLSAPLQQTPQQSQPFLPPPTGQQPQMPQQPASQYPQQGVPPQYPPNQYQQPTSNYPGYMDAQYQQPQAPTNLPQNIQPVKSSLFKRDEWIVLALFSLVGLGSHFLRYLLIYNKIPSAREFIYAIPLYLVFIFGIFAFNKAYLYKGGLASDIKADRFDHVVSLILSTFFLTTISHRSKINQEISTIPDSVLIPQPSKLGIEYVETPKMAYVGTKLRPRSIFIWNILITLVGFGVMYLYFNSPSVNWNSPLRLLTAYIGGLVVANIAPIFGRQNKEMTQIGRLRTLVLFLGALFVMTIGLLGESFFIALTN